MLANYGIKSTLSFIMASNKNLKYTLSVLSIITSFHRMYITTLYVLVNCHISRPTCAFCGSTPSVPTAPSNLQVTLADSSTATIVWTVPPPNVNSPLSPIQSYLLVLSEQQFNLPIVLINVTTNTHTFTGLQEFNTYTCIIAATNSVGQGLSSSPITFNTTQAGMYFY